MTHDEPTRQPRVHATAHEREAPPAAPVEEGGGASLGKLRIRVTDARDCPRASVTVALHDRTNAAIVSRKERTGADGLAEFGDLEPARQIVSVTIGAFERSAFGQVVAGRTTEVSVVVPQGGVVEGHVRDANRGVLAGVRLRFEQVTPEPPAAVLSTLTGDDGRYRLTPVPPGRYAVFIQGLVPRSRSPRFFFVKKGTGTDVKDFVLEVPSLFGVVRDKDTGGRLSAVRVIAQGQAHRVVYTNANGVYAFPDLARGTYQLTLIKDGYALTVVETVATTGTPRERDFSLRPAVVLHLHLEDDQRRPVRGRLTLGVVGKTQDGDEVNFIIREIADTDGHLRYARLVPGQYTLTIKMGDRPATTVQARLVSGENTTRVQLARAPETDVDPSQPSISGVVLDARNNVPLSGARVSVRGPVSSETYSDEQGRYRLGDLKPGDYSVDAKGTGYALRSIRSVKVVAGEPVTLELRLEAAAVVEFTLTDRDGEPVVGRVRFGYKSKKTRRTLGTVLETDGEGKARYEHIAPGLYYFFLLADGYGGTSRKFEVKPGHNEVTFQLK